MPAIELAMKIFSLCLISSGSDSKREKFLSFSNNFSKASWGLDWIISCHNLICFKDNSKISSVLLMLPKCPKKSLSAFNFFNSLILFMYTSILNGGGVAGLK